MNKDDLEIHDGIRKEKERTESIEDVKDRWFIYCTVCSITFFIIGVGACYLHFQGGVNATCSLLDWEMSQYNVSWIVHNESDLTLLKERASQNRPSPFTCNDTLNLSCSEQRKAFILGDYLSNSTTITGYDGYSN